MDVLKNILANSEFSILTAFVLGLMTAISPCPLATNITAIGYLGRNIEDRRRVFLNGLVYTLGRATSYTLLAIILYLGVSQFSISRLFQGWGEKIIAPLLIVTGFIMLDLIKIRFPAFEKLTEKAEREGKNRLWYPFFLGIVFALAFCPASGVIFFAMLMPLTLASLSGLFLPVIYAIATGLPVILFAWLIAYAVGSVGRLYSRLRLFELWFRRSVAVVFICTGIYLLLEIYILST